MKQRARRIVIAGTGTGIGKTHAGVALTAALVAGGSIALGLKPIESGWTSTQSDGAELAKVSSFAPNPAPYTFEEALSPHLAARHAGIQIDFELIEAWLLSHAAEFLVIETAGGLLSPLGPKQRNLDWIRRLHPELLLLVAPDRLGVLHDVGTCCIALQTLAPELPEPWVVLQAPSSEDGSTGSNASELQTLGIARVATCFARAPAQAPETRIAAEKLISRCVSRETLAHQV